MPWSCGACTYSNATKATKCSICDTPRGKAKIVEEVPVPVSPPPVKAPVAKKPKEQLPSDDPMIGVTDLGDWEADDDDDDDMDLDEKGDETDGDGPASPKKKPGKSKPKKAKKEEKKKVKKKENDIWAEGDEDAWEADGEDLGPPKENDRKQVEAKETSITSLAGGVDEEDSHEYEVFDKDGVEKFQKGIIETTLNRIKEGKIVIQKEDVIELKTLTPEEEKKIAAAAADAKLLSKDDVILLLKHFKWDADTLFEEWLKDSTKCMLEGKIRTATPDEAVKTSEVDCGLCYSTVPLAKSFALQCEHRFCGDCWTGWLKAEHEKGPSSLLTRCPADKCPVIVPLSAQFKYLPKKLAPKLQQWDVDQFVNGNPYLAYCPAPKCSRSVHRLYLHVKGVKCVCTKKWCFECKADDHTPCGCLEFKTWRERIQKDGGASEYILAHTKSCPKCKVNIEKNQGCNHMTCSQCRHEFCWLCAGDWKSHAACNSFKQNTTTTSPEKDPEGARKLLERWVHYHGRFMAHQGSATFAQKTLAEAHKRSAQLQELKNTKAPSSLFLVDAAKEIIACRNVLAWSYVYAYYVAAKDTNTQRLLFEQHQNHLEKFTDKLHEMIEKPMSLLIENRHAREVQRLTGLIKKYRKNVNKNVTLTPLPSVLSIDKDKDKSALDPRSFVASTRKEIFSLLPSQKDMAKKPFSCAACTFVNSRGGKQCELCGTPRNIKE